MKSAASRPGTSLRLIAQPASGSGFTIPCARIRRAAISPRLSSCAVHAAKLKLRGLIALRARGAPGSRVAGGDEPCAPALDPAAPRAP